MKRPLPLIITAALLLAAIPSEAQISITGSGGDGLTTSCPPPRELAAISGVITASQMYACMTLTTMVHRSDIDDNGATNGYTTVQGVINAGGPDIPTGGLASFTYTPTGFTGCNHGSAGQLDDILAAGTGSAYHFVLDITGEHCKGYITLTITAGVVPVNLARFMFAVDIRAEQPYEDTFVQDNLNRLCAASTIGSACTTPTINAALTGTLSAVLSGSLALSGTLTVSDDAGGWAIHQDPLSGSLTICPAIAPCYSVLSGDLNQTTNVGNQTFIASSRTVLCGAGTEISNATSCEPVQAANATSDYFAPILLWAVAAILFLRHHKMLSALVCSLGVVIAAFSLPFAIHAIAIGALLIALWLEATAREDIILKFLGKKQTERRGNTE